MHDFEEWQERAEVARQLAALARQKAAPMPAENFVDTGNRRLNDLARMLELDAEFSEQIARDTQKDGEALLCRRIEQDINGR